MAITLSCNVICQFVFGPGSVLRTGAATEFDEVPFVVMIAMYKRKLDAVKRKRFGKMQFDFSPGSTNL